MTDTRVTISAERYAELVEAERRAVECYISPEHWESARWDSFYAMQSDAEKYRNLRAGKLLVNMDSIEQAAADAQLGALVRRMPEDGELRRHADSWTYNHLIANHYNPGFSKAADPEAALQRGLELEAAARETKAE